MKNAESGSSMGFVKIAVAGWRQVGAAAIAAVMLGVAGCATGPVGQAPQGDSPEARAELVKRRAQARWDALIKGDVKAAYDYLSPASRAVTSLERYQAKTNTAGFRSIRLDGVACEAEACKVRLWLTIDHRVMQGVTVPIEETWVFDGGQAWFVYRE
ncbi:MAG: hypothetical protein IT517_03370 [Burkholderiales bacterium]|nr:hypothetical protein [Burkholderiales bacterium]